MLELKDFTVGEKAYIVELHQGYNKEPEIIKTTVKKVGRKYVTVDTHNRRFKRHGNIIGLIEERDYGELGQLYNLYILAERAIEKEKLIKEIRWDFNCLYKLNNEELKIIKKALERGEIK